jgi:hypothetical protein
MNIWLHNTLCDLFYPFKSQGGNIPSTWSWRSCSIWMREFSNWRDHSIFMKNILQAYRPSYLWFSPPLIFFGGGSVISAGTIHDLRCLKKTDQILVTVSDRARQTFEPDMEESGAPKKKKNLPTYLPIPSWGYRKKISSVSLKRFPARIL